KRLIALNLDRIAATYSWQGDSKLTVDYYQKSLPIYEAMEDREGIARALNGIGLSEQFQGNYDRALDFFQKAMALNDSLGDKRGIADKLINIGETRRLQGRYAQSLEAAEHAAALAEQNGERQLFQEARTLEGLAHLALNQPAQARQSFEKAIATVEALRAEVAGAERERQQFFENKGSPYYGMVRLLVAQNRPGEALVYAELVRARALLDVLQNGRASVTKSM